MASQTSICNRALELLGGGYIISILDDKKEARALLRAYDSVRDALLRAHVWNFAKKRIALPALTAAPTWGFARQFQLPSDCLRFLEAENEEFVKYEIEGRRILTDEGAPFRIIYIYRCTDPNEYDALFAEAFAAKLGLEIAEDITSSNSKKQDARTAFDTAMREAKRIDAQENQSKDLPEVPWLSARR